MVGDHGLSWNSSLNLYGWDDLWAFCNKRIARQNKHDLMSWILPNLCQLQQRSLLEAEWINKSWASSSIINDQHFVDIHAVDCMNWIDFTFLYWLISFSQPDLFPSVGLTTWPSLGGEGHLNYYPKLLFHTLGITTPSLQQKLHWLVTTKAPVHVVRAQEVWDLLPHVST